MKLEVGDHCYFYNGDTIERAIVKDVDSSRDRYYLIQEYREYDNAYIDAENAFSNLEDLYLSNCNKIENLRRHDLDALLRDTLKTENKWEKEKKKLQKAVYDYKKFITKY